MSLPDPYHVQPLRGPLRGSVAIPGSKSLTNRALILAALSSGKVVLPGALFSRDTRLMADALQTLGFSLHNEEAQSTMVVEGQSGKIPQREATLKVGNSGTTARFLAALVCLEKGGTYRFEGDAEMERRPMQGLLHSLTQAGWADVEYHRETGFIPFTLRTHGLSGGTVEVDPSESSQMLSALLLAATRADQPIQITTAKHSFRRSYVELTRKVIQAFGGSSEFNSEAGEYQVFPGLEDRAEFRYPVEPDASSASYFFAAPLVIPGSLQIPGFSEKSRLQGDMAFLNFLQQCGLTVEAIEGALLVQGEGKVQSAPANNFYEFSDTFLTFAALSPLFPEATTLSGLAHTRKQETDRVAGMASELRKLAVSVEEKEDSLTLDPDLGALKQLAQKQRPMIIETYKDHRFAMSFAILGLYDLLGTGEPWLAIRDPFCCAKTFPRFFQLLESLAIKSP